MAIRYTLVVEIQDTVSKRTAKHIETDMRSAKGNVEEWLDKYAQSELRVSLSKHEDLKGIS